MNANTTAPTGVVSSTELGGRTCEHDCAGCDDCTAFVSGDDDGDLQPRYDMLKSWLVEADVSNERLKKHLGNVLEIAHTWQPGYATKMDRDTLALAAQAIGYEPPNTEAQRAGTGPTGAQS